MALMRTHGLRTMNLSLRAISTSSCLLHNPGLKKKSKPLLDQKKLKKQQEKQEYRQRKQMIQPPVDPDSIPDPSWFNADWQRVIDVVSKEQIESNSLLRKEWSRYQMKNHINDLRMIRDKVKCRSDALRELKKESEFLYQEAEKVDKTFLPSTFIGPMETAPLEVYEPPDFVDERK